MCTSLSYTICTDLTEHTDVIRSESILSFVTCIQAATPCRTLSFLVATAKDVRAARTLSRWDALAESPELPAANPDPCWLEPYAPPYFDELITGWLLDLLYGFEPVHNRKQWSCIEMNWSKIPSKGTAENTILSEATLNTFCIQYQVIEVWSDWIYYNMYEQCYWFEVNPYLARVFCDQVFKK